MKSDRSMDLPRHFRGEVTGDSRELNRILRSLESGGLEETNSGKLIVAKRFLLRTLMKLKKDEKLKLFQSHLSQDYPEYTEQEQEDPEALYIVEKMLETCGSERSLKITLHILRNMKQKDLADSLEREAQNCKRFLSLILCVH
ncbi:hypothetical protein SKAU_G00152090 [Synaphobranchus kaupii]|uniref:Pyrin domain-containing protein n=1 Tax=Synaphobranchus kaupii TaxID=118154 RepID=A0A9Q1FGV0_SYNKA|nr:hypothetical protein SKAU_G00152090 [Synaphobranchus kaupii]